MRLAALVSVLLPPTWALGQACEPPVAAPIDAYPAGTVIEGIGKSDIPVTTKSPECLALTRQGFALIHCFWFNEAARSFRDAVAADPQCSIAWAGLHLSLTVPWYRRPQFRQEAEYAIRQAVGHYNQGSPLEQELVIALRVRSAKHSDKEGAFELAMRELIDRHPDANEPLLILAGIRAMICMFDRTLPDGTVDNELRKVAELVEPVLGRDPDNAAAHHYAIHAYEGSRPEKALVSADSLSALAPASAHMVHMPGHVYNVLGLWEKADAAFAASDLIGRTYSEKIGVKPEQADWNYGHNRDYWALNMVEQGRVADGLALTRFAGRRADWLWRTSDWNALLETIKDAGSSFQVDFYRGTACAWLGRLDEALLHLKALKERPKPDPKSWNATRIHETRLNELEGLLLLKKGKADEGLALIKKAATTFGLIEYEEPPYYLRPPLETLAQALISIGRGEEALKAIEELEKVKPNNGHALFLRAEALAASGRPEEARTAYQAFLQAWNRADPERPQVTKAKAALASQRHGIQ